MNEVRGKTIWITGASSGIGQAVASRLALDGNFVIASSRSEEKLQSLKARFPKHIALLACDVGDSDSMVKAAEKLASITDFLDIAIVCAGTCEYDDGPKLDEAMYQRVMQTNFFGALATIRIALPLLQAAKEKPLLVGVGSIVVRAAFPRAEAYGASKAAFDYLFQSLKIDLLDKNIDVTLVRPGFVDTPLTQQNDFDMPFMVNTERAANDIVRGISRRATFIEFPKRLSLILKLAHVFPRFWLSCIAPALTKKTH